MKFTSFLDSDYKSMLEAKLKESISNDTLNQYRETLIARGTDLTYTLATRGFDTPSDSIEDIIDAAISIISSEVDGVVKVAVGSKSDNSIKGFKRDKKINVTKSSQALRSTNGRFIGALKLASLLNTMVKINAAEIMKNLSHGNTLNFQTGRLANSGNVTSFNLKTGSIFFNYMYYPYKTFEPGGKQFKPGRDPRDIFANAIAESLRQLISSKDLANSKFAVYAGRSRHGTIAGGLYSER